MHALAHSKLRRGEVFALCEQQHAFPDGPDGGVSADRLYFRVVSTALGNKKLMKVAPAAGRRFNAGDFVIAVRRAFELNGNTCLIDHTGVTEMSGSLLVAHDLGQPEHLHDGLLCWSKDQGIRYSLKDLNS